MTLYAMICLVLRLLAHLVSQAVEDADSRMQDFEEVLHEDADPHVGDCNDPFQW